MPTTASRPGSTKDVVARGVREEPLVACDGGVDLGPVRGDEDIARQAWPRGGRG